MMQLAGAVGFTALAGRTAWIQVVQGPELAARAKAERTVSWVNRAPRGQILGRDGTVLASSVVSYDVGVNQVLVSQYERREKRTDPTTGAEEEVVVGYGALAAAELLAPVLGVDVNELGGAMVGDSTYVIVAEAVTPDTWRQVKALDIQGIEPDQRSRRTYPAGRTAGNVVGYTSEKEHRVLTGAAGLELSQNDLLSGTDGEGSVEIGRSGVIIPTGEQQDTPATAGTTVRTTINPDLQALAQEVIDAAVDSQSADWGSIVVMEPSTGKILVMADSHTVDPSDPVASAAQDRGARVVQAVFEPGSVGKVVTFASALEQGAVTPTTPWTVPYSWVSPDGEEFHDSHEHPDQYLTSAQILAESSNVGTVQVGDTVSDQSRYELMKRFGWGTLSGIELPGESSGLLYPPDSWDGRTRYTTMFGQGVAVTALQAVQVLAAIANKGVRMPPRVIDAWIGADGKEIPQTQPEGVQVISEATAATLTDMLIGVTQEGGTAETASLDGYLVAGKTGTTEILTGEGGTVASFVGFTPARAPAIAVSVVLYRPEGVYGGTVSGPVFRKIATAAMHALGIAPDPTVVAAQAAARADAETSAPPGHSPDGG